jgi:hypothetical protein
MVSRIKIMRSLSFSIILCAGLALPVSADTLDMPQEPVTGRVEIDSSLPTRGMTMDSVMERYGAPLGRVDAVGDPPITRWNYDGFTVYFEYKWVIHTVDHEQRPRPVNP